MTEPTTHNIAATAVIHDGAYILGIAERDVAGYSPTTYGPYATYDEASDHARLINERLGLEPQEALEIVLSTMHSRADSSGGLLEANDDGTADDVSLCLLEAAD